jgi:uncharacterized protein
MGRFVLEQRGDQWFFNLQAGNYEPILHSEMYESKAAALNGIESVQKNSQRDGAFELQTAKDGQFYFVLKSTNGQVVGKSEMYRSESGRDNGVESVKQNSQGAETVEK